MLRVRKTMDGKERGAVEVMARPARSSVSFSGFQHFKMSDFQCSLQRATQPSAEAVARGVQGSRFFGVFDGGGCAEYVGGIDGFGDAGRGVAAEGEWSAGADEAVQNEPAVFAVEQDGAGAQVAGLQRPDGDAVAVANGWRHAWAARAESDRRVLLQQALDEHWVGLNFRGHITGL